MEFPGFWTWAFWNSQLVTTVIGAGVFAVIVALMAVKLSHRWEMRRKRFDFQLDTFRSFNDVSRDMLTQAFEFYTLRGTVQEADFQKKDDEWSYQVLATFNNTDAQINAAFCEKSIRVDQQTLRHILGQIRAKTLQTPKAPYCAEIQPLILNYLGQAEIIRLKMRREMELVSSKEYEDLMREAKDWTQSTTDSEKEG